MKRIQPKPKVGESFTDILGGKITRLTDVASWLGSKGVCRPEYPSIDPWSAEKTWFLLPVLDHFTLWDGATHKLYRDLVHLGTSAQPRWSRLVDNLFYFIEGNKLMQFDVELLSSEVTHEFKEYDSIDGKGEGDLAMNSDAMALYGRKADATPEVFIFDVSGGGAGVKYQTIPAPWADFDSLYISDTGLRLAATAEGRTMLFSRDGRLIDNLTTSGGHQDMTTVAGVEALVRFNADDTAPLNNCSDGVEVVPLLAPYDRKCLLTLTPPWTQAGHVSCDDRGAAYIEVCQPEGTMPGNYAGQIVRVNLLNGARAVKPLCWHNSAMRVLPDGKWDYGCWPLASVRGDGHELIFGSNWGQAGGPVDAFLLEIPQRKHGAHGPVHHEAAA